MATTPVSVERRAAQPAGVSDRWLSLRGDMDRLFDAFTAPFGLPSLRFDTAASTVPPIDVAEDEAAFTLTAELPGMTDKDVEVALSGDTLTVRGEKRQEHEENTKDYHVRERSYGSFKRAFTLPANVDREKITAECTNGVLRVVMPKGSQAGPKKIEVKKAA